MWVNDFCHFYTVILDVDNFSSFDIKYIFIPMVPCLVRWNYYT